MHVILRNKNHLVGYLSQTGSSGKLVGTIAGTSAGASQGPPGPPGYTPQRGVDYWTHDDQQQIIREVLSSEEIEQIQNDIEKLRADMTYVAIDITSISNNVGTVEMGTTVREMKVTWALNKTPASQTLAGIPVDVNERSATVDMTGKTSVTLAVADERDAKDSASTGYKSYNGVYYGASAMPATLNSAFILGLKKELSGSKGRTITVNSGENQHIWYALPSRLGTCSFAVGGFSGGFDLIDTIDFTNASGYTEPYNVYASAKTGLGETKVVIS